MAPVRNPLGIFDCLPRIGKQPLHLLFTLHIILTALITHTVFVRKLLSGLQTQEDIMRLHVIRIGIVHVIRYDHRNIQFPAHL